MQGNEGRHTHTTTIPNRKVVMIHMLNIAKLVRNINSYFFPSEAGEAHYTDYLYMYGQYVVYGGILLIFFG